MTGRSIELPREQSTKAGGDFIDDRGGYASGEGCIACSPVDTLQLIREYDARNRQLAWQGNLERIAFRLAGDRTDEREITALIVARR